MKISSEVLRIIGVINDANNQKDYQTIYKLKNEVFNNFDCLVDTYCFNALIRSAFNLSMYDDVVLMYEELLNRQYESNEILYYVLLSCLANGDIFHGMSIINKSKILNHPDSKKYLEEGGANYLALQELSYKTEYILLSLVLANFMTGLMKEMMMGITINKEYLFERFVELINELYELAYHEQVINDLTEKLKKIFLL